MSWSFVAGADDRKAAVADNCRPSGRTQPSVYADNGCPAKRTSKEDSKEKTLIEGEEELYCGARFERAAAKKKQATLRRTIPGRKGSGDARDRMKNQEKKAK